MNQIKTKQILLAIFSILLLSSYNNQLFAQEPASKKKVVIITKKIDADGNEVTEKKVLEGEDAEAFKIDDHMEGDSENIDVNIEKSSDGKEKKVIKIRTKKDGEDVEEIIIDGDDENVRILENDGGVIIMRKDTDEDDKEMNIDVTEKDGKVIIKKTDSDGKVETIEVMDEGENVFIMSDDDDGDNVEVEKIIMDEDGEKKEIIIQRQYKGNSNKAFLGVALEKGTEDGVLVDKVIEGSPAEKAGLKKGDVITHINKSPISSLDELTKSLSPFKADDKVAITYKRNGAATTATARLAKNDHKAKKETKSIWISEDDEEIDLDGKEHKIIKKKKGNS